MALQIYPRLKIRRGLLAVMQSGKCVGKEKQGIPFRKSLVVACRYKISAWRTEEHDVLPSDRTTSSRKPENPCVPRVFGIALII